jgi:hypothetical protein
MIDLNQHQNGKTRDVDKKANECTLKEKKLFLFNLFCLSLSL